MTTGLELLSNLFEDYHILESYPSYYSAHISQWSALSMTGQTLPLHFVLLCLRGGQLFGPVGRIGSFDELLWAGSAPLLSPTFRMQ